MISVKLVLCAETVFVDANSNAVSAIGIYDDMDPEGYPYLFTKMTFLVIHHKETNDPKEHDANIKITLNEKILFSGPVKVDFQGKVINRFIWGVGGLIIPEPGILKFEMTGQTIPAAVYQMKLSVAGPKVIK